MEDLILNLLFYICPQYPHFVTFQIPLLCGEVTNVQTQAQRKFSFISQHKAFLI